MFSIRTGRTAANGYTSGTATIGAHSNAYAVFEFNTVKTVATSGSERWRIVGVTQTQAGNIAAVDTTTWAYFSGAKTAGTPASGGTAAVASTYGRVGSGRV